MLTKQAPAEAHVDPRTKRTRQLILKAFGELLADKSFEAVTIQDITDRATVNRATFYAHFQDKYDLLEQAFAEMFQEILRKNLPPSSDFRPNNVQLLIQAVCEFLEQVHNHCAVSSRAQFDSVIEQQVKLQVYEVLKNWLENPAPSSKGNGEAELRATVASWAIYGAARRWSQGKRLESAPDFARQALPIILAGLKAKVVG